MKPFLFTGIERASMRRVLIFLFLILPISWKMNARGSGMSVVPNPLLTVGGGRSQWTGVPSFAGRISSPTVQNFATAAGWAPVCHAMSGLLQAAGVEAEFHEQWQKWRRMPSTAELRYQCAECSLCLRPLTPGDLLELFEPMLSAPDSAAYFNDSILPQLLDEEQLRNSGQPLSQYKLLDGHFVQEGERIAVREGTRVQVNDGETVVVRSLMDEIRIYAAANSAFRCPTFRDFVFVPLLSSSQLKLLEQADGVSRFAVTAGEPIPAELLAMVPGSTQRAGTPDLCSIEAFTETRGVRQFFDRHDDGSVFRYVFQDGFVQYPGGQLTPTLSVSARVSSVGVVEFVRVVLMQECAFEQAVADPAVFLVPCKLGDTVVDARLGDERLDVFRPASAEVSVLSARPAIPESSNSLPRRQPWSWKQLATTIGVSAAAIWSLWRIARIRGTMAQ
jgi:hypothetical protein